MADWIWILLCFWNTSFHSKIVNTSWLAHKKTHTTTYLPAFVMQYKLDLPKSEIMPLN